MPLSAVLAIAAAVSLVAAAAFIESSSDNAAATNPQLINLLIVALRRLFAQFAR